MDLPRSQHSPGPSTPLPALKDDAKNAFELDRSQSALAEEAAPTNRGFVTTRIGRISKPSRRHPSSNHSTNNSRAAGSRSQPRPCHRKPENRTPQNRLHRAARNTRAMERQVHRRQADVDVESFSDSSQSQDVDATNLDLHHIRRLSRATSPVDQSHDGSDDLTFEEPLRVPSYDTSLSKNNTIGSVPVAIDGEAPDSAFIQPTATVGHHQEQVDTLYTVDGDQIFSPRSLLVHTAETALHRVSTQQELPTLVNPKTGLSYVLNSAFHTDIAETAAKPPEGFGSPLNPATALPPPEPHVNPAFDVGSNRKRIEVPAPRSPLAHVTDTVSGQRRLHRATLLNNLGITPSEVIRDTENWKHVLDPTERRKIQNRQSQRRHRMYPLCLDGVATYQKIGKRKVGCPVSKWVWARSQVGRDNIL